MRSRALKLVVTAGLLTWLGGSFAQQQKKEEQDTADILGEFAPPDAYLPGAKHPYFGSENPWDRRFFSEQTAANLYFRRGQRQMLDIVEGRTDRAIAYCQELLAKDPADLESLFNLAVAYSQRGDIDQAMEAVKSAVNKGLALNRFLAGPRNLLKPLTESPAFREYAAGQDLAQLIHGPMVGSVTDHSARFWVRTRDSVAVQAVVSLWPDLQEPLRSRQGRTDPAKDYTAIVEVTGLQGDKTYYYDILLDDKSALRGEFPSFRTFPAPGRPARFQVAFAGGASYNPSNERVWDLIRSYSLAAFLFMGDNVYIDMPEMPNGVHYYTYYRRQSRPEYRSLVSSTPIYAIWDDHDAGMDDVWLGPHKDKPAWKMPLFRQFQENWNNPAYGDPEWPGCWFNFSIGPVEIFMLECRFYRTNPFDKDPTMLGPVQKAWLKKRLERSKATFKVLASSVPWTFQSKGGAKDTWNGFPEERKEIFDFLAENRIDGVVLLSADRHRSDAWRIERPNGYALYEFESSRVTNQHVHELVPEALFGYNAKQSFGLLTFDTTVADPTVKFEIVSIDNEVVGTQMVKRSEISHQAAPVAR